MGRLTALMVAPVFIIALFFLVTILLIFVIGETKSPQPGIVHLESTIPGGDRDGLVTRTDKSVTVDSASHGSETFNWSQIRYISEKNLSPTRLDRVVDLIDLWSKLGIAATLVFFMIGLHQYGQGQKWEREKFLAGAVKELIEWKPNRNAMHMIDSLVLYQKGRMVELFPDEEKAADRKVFVTNDEISEALTPTPLQDIDESDVRAIAIRDCFDSFLSYIGTFDHYIEQNLITKDALIAHLGYWIVLFGPKGTISSAHKQRILTYAATYGITEFQSLIDKYNRPSVWERITRLFVR